MGGYFTARPPSKKNLGQEESQDEAEVEGQDLTEEDMEEEPNEEDPVIEVED